MILPETAAQKLLVSHGRVVGVRTGDKGRSREGGELGNFEPGSDLVAKVTVLAEGTQGHLTGVALDRFGLRGEEPQVWELAVKEVWKVAKPLDRIIHTMGWPLRTGKRYREFGGSFIYPMGEDMVTIGLVVGLDYRDASLSVHDLLQELKTHPKIRQDPRRAASACEWGAKTIPSGGFHSLPQRAARAGAAALRRRRRAWSTSRASRASTTRSSRAGSRPRPRSARCSAARRPRRALSSLRRRGARQLHLERPARGAEHAPGLRARLLRRRRARERDDGVEGARRAREAARRSRTPTQPLLVTDRAASYPAPDGKLTFDKLSSVFASGNKTRDDQPNHIRIERQRARARSRGSGRTCARRRCTRSGAEDGDGTVTVELAPSNCVQCGAITAKGGRLTPPEGGSGPEYTRDLIYRGFTSTGRVQERQYGHVHRRFVLLAAVLVTLNVALWFAPPGLALRQAHRQPAVRPEHDPRRGDRRAAAARRRRTRSRRHHPGRTARSSRCREARHAGPADPARRHDRKSSTSDGTALAERLAQAAGTCVVTWPANGAAQSVDVEKIPRRSTRLR